MRCGVVLFDSATANSIGDKTFVSLDAGWASVAGGTSTRISSIHDLDSAVLWITNLTEEQFHRAKLRFHVNFRHDGYLRSTLKHIASELGVDQDHVSGDVSASVLSTIVQRVVTYSRQHYCVTSKGKSLTDDFAVALRVPRSKIAPDIYQLFEGSAQHTYVRTVQTNAHLNHGTALTLRRNRVKHAKQILSLPVPPDANWEYIGADRLPSNKHDIESMLEQSDTAFLVHCNARNVNPSVAEVFSVSSGAKTIREWLTDIEWQQAREWSDIEYLGLLRCSAPSAKAQQADVLPSDPYSVLSFTCGLVAEQIWTAMTMQSKTNVEDLRYTAAAAWFRAMDRAVMFSYAKDLHAKGLTVWGYGSGNVVVLYPEGGLRNALDVSTESDLLTPSSKLLEARAMAPRDINVRH